MTAPPAMLARVIPDDIRDPRLQRFFDYWAGKRGHRKMPARRDLDPLDFPYILGNLMLIDVLGDPPRFRVRLHGANVVARMHYDMTGKQLDEVPRPEWRDYILDRCRGLAASGEPLLLMNDLLLDGWTSRYEALWLPLGDDGAHANVLVCGMIYGELGSAQG
ncbi:MAG TPA: PAS domain-containing protein [Stellaceae bacterium]|nr:PAS domain-containing protein [Stellaceae bacterium]